jgi:hypothetical protein
MKPYLGRFVFWVGIWAAFYLHELATLLIFIRIVDCIPAIEKIGALFLVATWMIAMLSTMQIGVIQNRKWTEEKWRQR